MPEEWSPAETLPAGLRINSGCYVVVPPGRQTAQDEPSRVDRIPSSNSAQHLRMWRLQMAQRFVARRDIAPL
jgi:hypothetical protein